MYYVLCYKTYPKNLEVSDIFHTFVNKNIKVMKKIIILLVIMFAAIGTVVAQQRKQPVKKTTVSAEEHLCFEGVPIDGTTEYFIKALAKKGIKALKDKETYDFVYKGKRCKTLLNSGCSSDNAFSIIIFYQFKGNEYNKAKLFLKDIIKNIKLKYKCKYTPYHDYSFDNDWGRADVYSLYSNANKKIGDLVCQISFEEIGGLVILEYIDYNNAIKYGGEYYKYCDSEIDWGKYPYTVNGFSDVNIGKEKNTGNIFIKATSYDNPNKTYKFVLTKEDKHLFCNLTETCRDVKLRDYLIKKLFENIKKVVEYPEDTYIIPDFLRTEIEFYYSRLEREERERERQRQQQLAQRRKSFGFMDFMHLLAPGFFTQDDVELWNKMSESDQKAIIQGSFGAYFGMGDTRGHTERMHTPSLRNQ